MTAGAHTSADGVLRPAPASPPPRVTIGLLGPLVLCCDGTEIQPEAAKQQVVLAALACRPGEIVTVGALVDELWGDHAPRTAANTLQTYVSRLRRRVGSADRGAHQLIRTRAHGYQLAVADDAVDATRFVALIERAREVCTRDLPAGHELLTEALALWRGPAFASLEVGSLLGPEATRLEELRLSASCERIELAIDLGRHAAVIHELQALITAQPLRERLSELLMTALYRSGRQVEALEVYRSLRALLVEELGIEPGPGIRAVQQAVLAQEPLPRPPAPGPMHISTLVPMPTDRGPGTEPAVRPDRVRPADELPVPLTELIGREQDVQSICRGVHLHRLVTLTGAGGCGKTRIAIAVAERIRGSMPHGIGFVDLGELAQGEPVVGAVAAGLGITGRPDRPPIEGLVDRLRHQEMLVVLDNAEHLVTALAPLVERLVSACPGLRVLVTSREALRVAGERIVAVRPLAVPPAAPCPLGELVRVPAVRLFAERAASMRPGFEVTDDSASSVIRICRTLDGIPLALELAAARLAVLGPEELADRLSDRFSLLVAGNRTAPERHRTLRAAVAWSHDLLADDERRLFARLGVFAGGFTLQAATAICGPVTERDLTDEPVEAEVLDLLGHLVAKSLVVAEPGPGGVRFRLLDTLRAYAREQLADAGETGGLRRAHATWYLGRLLGAEARLRDGQRRWCHHLDDEQDELCAALSWSLEAGDLTGALLLTRSLWSLWSTTGRIREGHRGTRRVLQPASDTPNSTERLHGQLLEQAAQLAWSRGELDVVETAAARDGWSSPAAAAATRAMHLVAGEADRAAELPVERLVRFTARAEPFGIG